MEASFFTRHPFMKDVMNIAIFIVCVLIGTLLINAFLFRSFSVIGPSMESTLYTGDRLIVDRLPVTLAHLENKNYQPKRCQIIVFKNPQYEPGVQDEYIVKRVIAFPGEYVQLKDGHYTVYSTKADMEAGKGFNPDSCAHGEPGSYTTGEISPTDPTYNPVPDGDLFVSGDHRYGDYSFDSRNGLGPIPEYDVVGPVQLRIYPFNKVRSF